MNDTQPQRLASLDVFRGATIALMILVNNPGDWAKTYAPLLHAEWDGWTPTDLVFPFFLFIVGVAIPFSLAGATPNRSLHAKIVRRSATLFGLGLLLAWAPFATVVWERARIPGVLQRIGVVFLCAALAFLHLKPRGRALLAGMLLGGYWLLMKFAPVPGGIAGDLSAQGNFAFWLDHQILGAHTWRFAPGPGDPEGILSTLPAIATALLGIFAGELLRRRLPPREALTRLLVSGAVLISLGLALARFFPVNKNLWSPTYVLFTGGFALLVLALCHAAIDLRPSPPPWAKPFSAFGKNSILAFVGSGALAKALILVKFDDGSANGASLQKVLYGTFYAPHLPDFVASLAWALTHVALWLLVVMWLDAKRVYWKV